MRKRLYLAGPMRGIANFNFPAFHKAAAILREEGYHVTSPAEEDEDNFGASAFTDPHGLTVYSEAFSLNDCLGADLDYICNEADVVAVLPGWENSKGTKAEIATAEALGLEIIYV